MAAIVDYPAILFLSLLVLFVAVTAFGAFVLRHRAPLPEDDRDDFSLVQTSTLTLLALLIGFTLSMAVNRYDQRKSLEESEANAIGTQYARADLTDAPISAQMKAALIRYTQLRLAEYYTRDHDELARIGRETVQVQAELWRRATQVAKDNPTPIAALVTSGMNDVLNSEDYSEAARINRVPIGAWVLMIVIALLGCTVQGYGAKGRLRRACSSSSCP